MHAISNENHVKKQVSDFEQKRVKNWNRSILDRLRFSRTCPHVKNISLTRFLDPKIWSISKNLPFINVAFESVFKTLKTNSRLKIRFDKGGCFVVGNFKGSERFKKFSDLFKCFFIHSGNNGLIWIVNCKLYYKVLVFQEHMFSSMRLRVISVEYRSYTY